jgi:hypothetical protein
MIAPFPRRDTVWRGAILGGIVDAVMTAESYSDRYLHGWVRNHYAVIGGDGRQGMITFAGGHWYSQAPLIGLFHDVHSKRYNSRNEVNLEHFFRGCPSYQRLLADQQALDFLKIEYEGRTLHHVTSAFWDEGEVLAASENWEIVLENGADLIGNEVVEDLNEALGKLQIEYGMSGEQVAFTKSLFERKMARPAAAIMLSDAEIEWLRSKSQEEGALAVALKKFEEMDIVARNPRASLQ